MEELNLKDLCKKLINKWWILLICIVLSATFAYVWSNYFSVPIYSAYTTLYVGKNVDEVGIQSNDLYIGTTLIEDYREIAKSKLVANEVINELGLKMSAGAMASRINVSQRGDTRVIQISVNDTNPNASMDITNKVAEVFKKKVSEIMQIENVQIIDKAELPLYPVSPDIRRNFIICIVIGFAIGVGIILLLELFNDKIVTPEDIKKHTELPVIGTIPIIKVKGRRA